MKGKGFARLTDKEYLILSAFKDDIELGFPVDCGLSTSETVQVLESLIHKNCIVGRAPYRLTKKGIKELREWKQS